MSWSTTAEAQSITGESHTQAELDLAQNVIELYVLVAEDALAELKPTDVRMLKKAEAYQSSWMKARVGFMIQKDTDEVVQDGLTYVKGDKDMHILSPLAKKAIKRISWMRSRTLDPLTPAQALALRNERTAETRGLGNWAGTGDTDDLGNWEPF